MKRLTELQLRRIIMNESGASRRATRRKTSPSKRRMPSLASLLFEADADALVQQANAKPVTIVALYGPPAAGKGAAKGAVGEFVGAGAEANYEDWLDAMEKEKAATFFQEEDELMVNAMTKTLPPLIFKELAGRVKGGEDFDEAISDYYHINETGKEFNLEDVLSKSAFDKILADNEDDVEAAAEEFANFPNTQAYFTQARGFSKSIEGASEDINMVLGATTEDGKTLGVRTMAAGKYMDKVKSEIKGMGATEVGDTTFASVYLMDQAGESTADTGRIEALGKLKEDPDFPSVTLIGVYIHQPQERTEIANLHRAATGGRRVSSKEVDRIFAAGPEIDGGKIVKKGDAISAMEKAFDQVHVYYPPNPFTPEDAKKFSGQICNPLGSGKGGLDIEGCDGTTSAKSLAGMEKQASKKAGVDDISDDDGLPSASKMDDEQKEKVVQALNDMGFSINASDLENYLETISPPNIRGGKKHGKVPWSTELFGDDFKGDDATVKGRAPTERITVKGESARTNRSNDDLVLERWQILAGILND
jgi:hypothetical protein